MYMPSAIDFDLSRLGDDWPASDGIRPGPIDSRGDFAATLLAIAGHDLRQPLQIITNAHEVLARTMRGDEPRKELALAHGAVAQLAAMLGQLVEAVQLHDLCGRPRPVPVSLESTLAEVAAEFAEPAQRKEIKLWIDPQQGAILSHPVLLRGMLRNLIRNAIEYTPPGGCVLVGSRRFGSKLHIEVRDSGIGIRAAALSRIFEAFERGDGEPGDGLGLGLFIVKHAADLLGHRILVESVEGHGSCFAIVAEATDCSAAA
ncbi:MAG TPA: HAMP domain-containing sensor histidine kinase [Stellaceae bacterium]